MRSRGRGLCPPAGPAAHRRGATHAAVASRVLAQYGLSIPVFGMVKDDRHRTRTIATEDGELSVSSFRAAFDLLTSIPG